MWIEFDGILNVRDLGGIPAADGRHVRPGRLLRGAGLQHASAADIERLKTELLLRHIVDFRDDSECARHPDPEIEGAEYHSIPALPGLPGHVRVTDGEPDFEPLFASLYRKLATDPVSVAAYRAFFRILLDCREGAVYFHCTQGKDRTGVGALLILSALGVSREDALEDYFLSNVGLAEAMEHPESPGSEHWSRETKERLFFVFQSTLDEYLTRVEAGWGGLDGFLRQSIGLTEEDIALLRRNYLE